MHLDLLQKVNLLQDAEAKKTLKINLKGPSELCILWKCKK